VRVMPSERARLVNRYRDRLLPLANVVGCGWGRKRVGGRPTDRECLVVFVRKKEPPQRLGRQEMVPRTLGEVPTDVVEVGDVRLLALPARHEDEGPVDRTARLRPAPPGVSIGHVLVSAGTFGAVVYDEETGERCILSNNHVLANQTDGTDERAAVGDPVLQPGPYDGGTVERDVIGHLLRFSPIRPPLSVPACGIARAVEAALNAPLRLLWPRYELRLLRRAEEDNLVDAALVKPVSPDAIRDTIVGIGRVRGTAEAFVGMKVMKSGRTSGVTYGEVLALGATLNVGLGGGVIARFADQIVTTAMAEPGDSGSLVLDERRRAVGLLFAGSDKATLCNRIQAVCEALRVSF